MLFLFTLEFFCNVRQPPLWRLKTIPIRELVEFMDNARERIPHARQPTIFEPKRVWCTFSHRKARN